MDTRVQTQIKTAPTPPFTPVQGELLQRKCACGGPSGTTGECEDCSSKRLTLQRHATNQAEPSTLPPIVREVLRSPGEPIDPATRAFMEPRFGHDLGSIRVHTDASSAEFARDLNARAVTLGLHVYFRAGCYRPETTAGQDLIAHELGHIAGSSPKGPTVPKLQPDSPRDHEAALRNMLETDKFRDGSFWGYLSAHPDSVDVAGRLLVNEMVNGPAPRPRVSTLLRSFIRRHPESRHGIEAYMPVATDHLRSKAEEKVKAMWDQYEASAYLDAFIQWATNRLQEERQHHPHARGQSVPTPLEAQYQMWLPRSPGVPRGVTFGTTGRAGAAGA